MPVDPRWRRGRSAAGSDPQSASPWRSASSRRPSPQRDPPSRKCSATWSMKGCVPSARRPRERAPRPRARAWLRGSRRATIERGHAACDFASVLGTRRCRARSPRSRASVEPREDLSASRPACPPSRSARAARSATPGASRPRAVAISIAWVRNSIGALADRSGGFALEVERPGQAGQHPDPRPPESPAPSAAAASSSRLDAPPGRPARAASTPPRNPAAAARQELAVVDLAGRRPRPGPDRLPEGLLERLGRRGLAHGRAELQREHLRRGCAGRPRRRSAQRRDATPGHRRGRAPAP